MISLMIAAAVTLGPAVPPQKQLPLSICTWKRCSHHNGVLFDCGPEQRGTNLELGDVVAATVGTGGAVWHDCKPGVTSDPR